MKLMQRPGASVTAKDEALEPYGSASQSSASSRTSPPQRRAYEAGNASTYVIVAKSANVVVQVPSEALAPLTQDIGSGRPSAILEVPDRLKHLHAVTTLTWQQIGRLFGVSRRAVHHWVAGNRMSAANLDRLTRIERAVAALDGSPEQVHAQLMARNDGPSLYAELLRDLAESRPAAEPRSWVERSSVTEP